MRNLGLAVLVVASACSARTPATPEAPPLKPGQEVLATFTAYVDLQAGTFEIVSTPVGGAVSPGSAPGSRLVSVDSNVVVANVPGSYWYHGVGSAPQPCTPDGDSTATWGAEVEVKTASATEYLSDVYAEITEFAAGTGQEACNSAGAPSGSGLDNTNGLWSYGAIQGSYYGTATVTSKPWIFRYVNSSSFKFSGRVVGSRRISVADLVATPPPVARVVSDGLGVIAGDATHLVVGAVSYGDTTLYHLDRVNLTSLQNAGSVQVSMTPRSVALSPAVVWYTTYGKPDGANAGKSWVGSVNLDGSGLDERLFSTLQDRLPIVIVPDPSSQLRDTRAWVLTYDATRAGHVSDLYRYDRGTGLQAPFRVIQQGDAGWMVALQGYLLITDPANNRIVAFLTNGPSIAWSIDVPPSMGCSTPSYVIAGAGVNANKVYFGAQDPTDGNSVCSISSSWNGSFNDLVFKNEGQVDNPSAMALDPSGTGVFVSGSSQAKGSYVRWLDLVGSKAPYDIAVPGAVNHYSLGAGAAATWITAARQSADPVLYRLIQ